MRSPLIVAGMHRSGTSLVAAFLTETGIDMGEVIPADANNPSGYFEDTHFLALQREILVDCSRADDGGHPDWGWTESERLDRSRIPRYRARAQALLSRFESRGGPWGWKDPRTTLLLDFWAELLPEARYLLVYRFPWDVADSMRRLGADVFLDNPSYAGRIWAFYCRHLLEFYRRHRPRCVLASTNAIVHRPQDLIAKLESKLGLELAEVDFDRLFDRTRFHTGRGTALAMDLHASLLPRRLDLLEELDREADLSGAAHWRRRSLSLP